MAHLESAGTRSTPTTTASGQVIVPSVSRQRWFYRLLPALLIVTGLLLWEWSVHSGRTSALFFPAPTTIAVTLARLLVQDDLLSDVAVTLYRMGVGLLIGGTAGIVLGLLMGWSARVRMVAEPFVAGLHPIPKTALLPLLLILMGIGDQPRFALIALATFFPMLINTMSSVRSIEPVYLEAASNYGARGVRLFRRIIVPASLPGILSGGRIAVNTAMTIAITTELLMSSNGLGARIWMAWETLRTENLYATLIVIATIGLLINWLVVQLERRLMPWSPATTTLENEKNGESSMIARRSTPIAIVILLLTILVGCTGAVQPMTTSAATSGPSPAAPATPAKTAAHISLKVAVGPYLSYAPFYIAAAEGYFEEQGLDVEIVRVTRTADAIASLAQGQLDVAGLSISSALLNAIVRDSGIKIVASKERLIEHVCVYSGLVARKGSALFDSDKITPELLKGLRYDITPTSLSGYTLDKVLQKYGLTIDDIKLANMANSIDSLNAMQQGALDVSSMIEPWITRARAAGAGDVWLARDAVTPDNQHAIIAYGPTLLKSNPEAGQRFMVAYLKGVRRFAEGLTEPTLAILEKELELDRALLTEMCPPYIPPDGAINAQSIIDFGNWAAAKGYIDAPVTAAMFWEPRFVDYARQALGTP